jgi:type IV pili sensor histidine kinase/response regulator
MYPFQKTRVVPLAFLIALIAGCAQQQPAPQPSESERLAADYPDADKVTIARTDGTGQSRVVATGLDQPTHEVEPDVYRDRDASRVEVMRGGRYALVTANATLQQRNLLEQTVNISIPVSMNPSVEDGLRYTLQHTGYSLCAPQGEPQELLYSRALPAAHFRLGPMPLRETLQVLAGSAFEVQADPIARTICYQVRDQRLIEETGHDG